MSRLECDKILYWYDQPVLFTAMIYNQRMIVSLIDDNRGKNIYMAASITDDVLEAIEENRLSIYGAYTSSERMLRISCDEELEIIEMKETDPLEMKKSMPEPNAGIDLGKVPDVLI